MLTNKILLATDFQEESKNALKFAVYFAKKMSAELVLLHVIPEDNMLFRLFSSEEKKQQMLQSVSKLMDEMVESFRESVKISPLVKFGKVYAEVEKLAEELEPLFILLGKSEADSVKKKLLGSNAHHVIRVTDYPVMTVRNKNLLEDYQRADNEIILPLDLTKEIHEQLSFAIEFGKKFEKIIKLVTVLDANSVALELKLLTRMNEAQKIVSQAGLECTTHMIKTENKRISEAIIDYAVEESANMIMIMTQQERNFMRLSIGHTAREILENSPVAVVSLTPWDKAEESVIGNFVNPLGIL